jgi:heme A synthase
MGAILIGGTAGMMLLGASGGVAALGDTLFPVTSLGEGFAQDLSPGAHFLVRLRVLHPLLAFSVAALVSAMALWGALAARGPDLRSASWMLISLFFLQIVVGFINLGLLAPVPLQLLHLLMADLVWMGFVRFASLWTQEREAREAAPRA